MLTFEPEQGHTEVFEPNYNTMSLMVEAKPGCNEVYLKTGANVNRTYNLKFCRPATIEETERYTALKYSSQYFPFGSQRSRLSNPDTHVPTPHIYA
jgi:hypothetical protein